MTFHIVAAGGGIRFVSGKLLFRNLDYNLNFESHNQHQHLLLPDVMGLVSSRDFTLNSVLINISSYKRSLAIIFLHLQR
jgi:hypothetical protein